MTRFFNTAGPCSPDKHFMVPAGPRVAELKRLIDQQLYYVVHAPRQAGKTTSVKALAEELTAEGNYVALHTTCETGQKLKPDLEGSIQAVLDILKMRAQSFLSPEARPPAGDRTIPPESRLSDLLHRWARQCPRPLVIFFDEIDALYDDALISVLRQLRSCFDTRPESFPQSVALIGLRDVRDYRILSMAAERDSATLGTSSPFNIKSDSFTLQNFQEAEVVALLRQHTEETGQIFSDEVMTQIYRLTLGQPWLVNALGRQLVETVVPDRERKIGLEDLDLAKEILIRRRDTHLDSLLDRLREPRVRRVLEPIVAGEVPEDDVLDDDLQFAKDLGLVVVGDRGLEIANPIYREVVPRALTSVAEHYVPMRRASFVRDDGSLSWDALLDGFTAFWKQNAEWMLRRQPYSEAAAQLIFMAFLHRLVNGIDLNRELLKSHRAIATVDREFAVGSGRIDLLVRWPVPNGDAQRFAVELKVQRPGQADPLEDGKRQLGEYLKRLGLSTGTLILFDLREDTVPWSERGSRSIVQHKDHEITVLKL